MHPTENNPKQSLYYLATAQTTASSSSVFLTAFYAVAYLTFRSMRIQQIFLKNSALYLLYSGLIKFRSLQI